jgi:inner membrane protein
MRLPNHIAGGFCLAGFFTSIFFSINILSSPWALATVVAGSILPDVDNTKSLAGKLLYPIARWTNRKFGHRTLTHSVLFLVCLSVVGGVVERTFTGGASFTVILVTAWFVHVILDTFTLQGVQMMFPFSFEPYWMFDRPEARIRNGDFKAEGMFFLAFVVLSFAQQNLWKNGFWTSFNSNFGTVAHLDAEQQRSDDGLNVEAKIKVGTEEKTVAGQLVRVDGETFVLLDNSGNFQTIGDDEQFVSATFTHTGKPFKIQSQNLINLTADSLNTTLKGKKLLQIELQATTTFQVTESNSYPKTVSTYAAQLLSNPPFFAAITQAQALNSYTPDKSYLAEIQLLQSDIRRIRSDASDASADAAAHERRLSELRSQYAATSDFSERQKLHDDIEEEEKQTARQVDLSRVAEIEDRILKIRKEAGFRESAKKGEVEAKNREELSKTVELRFTGIVTFLASDSAAAAPIGDSAGAEPTPSQAISGDLGQKQQQKSYKVIGIKDGDTIEVLDDSSKTTFVIRLAHVDCPERSQAFGNRAKQFTSEFCFGKQITFQQTDTDRYGRTVAEIFVEGTSLNLALVEAGFAWHYKKYSNEQRYSDAETAARAAKTGLWIDPNPTPPWDYRKK